jgi:hypothetical protein
LREALVRRFADSEALGLRVEIAARPSRWFGGIV